MLTQNRHDGQSPSVLELRTYGDRGPEVILVHGGPGMAGYLAPVARALAWEFRVVEPLQRRSGVVPLTVAQHVADLDEVVAATDRPAVVGSSWGAMLALAWAAVHPGRARSLVLVGCGTFDPEARGIFLRRVEERTTELQGRLGPLRRELADRDAFFARVGELMLPAYSYELVSSELEVAFVDARGFDQTWADMLRCQEDGTYPARLARVCEPVLMVHGDTDPHPGAMTRDTLRRYLPHLEYVGLDRCGHYPWLERHARAEFFETLRAWLRRHG